MIIKYLLVLFAVLAIAGSSSAFESMHTFQGDGFEFVVRADLMAEDTDLSPTVGSYLSVGTPVLPAAQYTVDGEDVVRCLWAYVGVVNWPGRDGVFVTGYKCDNRDHFVSVELRSRMDIHSTDSQPALLNLSDFSIARIYSEWVGPKSEVTSIISTTTEPAECRE